MSKTWEQLSQAEKVEDLRRDVVRIFRVLDAVNHAQSALATHLDQTAKTASSAAAAAEALRARVSLADAVLQALQDHDLSTVVRDSLKQGDLLP